jgi:hypothetical protein
MTCFAGVRVIITPKLHGLSPRANYSLSNSAGVFVFYCSLLLRLQRAIAISAVTLVHQTGKEITGFRIELTVHYYLALR